MRKGLPSVRTADGRMPTGGDKGADDEEFAIDDDEETEAQEKMDEEEAAAEMSKPQKAQAQTTPSGQAIPALDEEQEYEWKWKVGLKPLDKANPQQPKMEVSRRTFFL